MEQRRPNEYTVVKKKGDKEMKGAQEKEREKNKQSNMKEEIKVAWVVFTLIDTYTIIIALSL